MRRATIPVPSTSTVLFLLSLAVLLFLAAAAASAGGYGGHRHHGRGFNVSVGHGSDGDPRDCSDVRITSDQAIATAEERHSFVVTSTPIALESSENGGLFVTGSDGLEIEVLVCKAALGDTAAEANDHLARIRVETGKSRLVARGVDHEDGIAYVIVRAPRGAALDLSMSNGPLSVRGVEGKLSIHGSNGPVSLDDVGGEISVELENGPTSLSGGSGSIRIRTENGPVSVDLGAGDWQGEGLDARVVNGPLSLKLDEDFRSSVHVRSSDHAPWDCGKVCRRASKDWDDDARSVSFGDAPYKVRLSTENGPVSID